MLAALWIFRAYLQKYKVNNQDNCVMTIGKDQVEAAFRARCWKVSGDPPAL